MSVWRTITVRLRIQQTYEDLKKNQCITVYKIYRWYLLAIINVTSIIIYHGKFTQHYRIGRYPHTTVSYLRKCSILLCRLKNVRFIVELVHSFAWFISINIYHYASIPARGDFYVHNALHVCFFDFVNKFYHVCLWYRSCLYIVVH